MCVDVRRLAELTAELAAGTAAPGRKRAAALRDYPGNVFAEIRNHHDTEDAVMWPVIVAAAGPHADLVQLTDDHHRLDPMLKGGRVIAAEHATAPADRETAGRLSAVLQELSELLDRHVATEEREVFPLISQFVRVDDFTWAERHLQRNVALRLLPFLVPWVIRHATAPERAQILGQACLVLRIVLKVFGARFAAQERLVFGGTL